jgi:choline dehydrogenase-like flavoprotein
MKSVGESMAIGRTFKEAFQKGLRALEIGRPGWSAAARPQDDRLADDSLEALRGALRQPTPERIFQLKRALEAGMTIQQLHEMTAIDPWFLGQMRELVDAERRYATLIEPTAADVREMKRMGFSDRQLAELRDESEGEVRSRREGSPRVRYRLTAKDVDHVRTGVDGAAQILEAAGARRILSSHQRLVSYEPGRSTRAEFVRAADAVGYGPGRCAFYGFHQMGSARIGGSPSTSACNPEGQTWDVRGLYVMDGSSFPSASGVNPMITIEALAHLNASRLAARLA